MKTLPDFLREGMRLVVVGFNPGEASARAGHYYAGRGNLFWPLLYQAGIVSEQLDAEDDRRVMEFGIGLTDLVKRPSRGIEEIAREEYAEGRVMLSQKLEQYRPLAIAFNGKLTYEKFSSRACKLGAQKERLYEARVFVLPSTSGQNTTESPAEKLAYFKQLAAVLAEKSMAKGAGRD